MRKLSFVFILAISLSGCLQTYNSSSGDLYRYENSTIDESTGAGQRFAAAYEVLRNNCFQCHNAWTAQTTSDAWVNAGFVVAQNPAGSMLYGYIRGSGVGGPESMPQGGTLSADELQIINTWISQIGL